MSLSEAEQSFIFSNFLNKEKVDQVREAFLKKREQESNAKELVSWNGAINLLIESGFFVSDRKKFDLVAKFDLRSTCDFREVLKMMCYVLLSEERREAQESSAEYLDAFVAIGGNKDGSGHISPQQLEAALEEFGLTIDVPSILEAFDIQEPNLTYESFCKIFDKTIMEESQSAHSEATVS